MSHCNIRLYFALYDATFLRTLHVKMLDLIGKYLAFSVVCVSLVTGYIVLFSLYGIPVFEHESSHLFFLNLTVCCDSTRVKNYIF